MSAGRQAQYTNLLIYSLTNLLTYVHHTAQRYHH